VATPSSIVGERDGRRLAETRVEPALIVQGGIVRVRKSPLLVEDDKALAELLEWHFVRDESIVRKSGHHFRIKRCDHKELEHDA
jgi:hypothetical protein